MPYGRTAARIAPPWTGHPSALLCRPNDGSGYWPGYSNTGYLHDPGYTGTGGTCTHGYAGLSDYTAGMTPSGTVNVDSGGPLSLTFSQVHFRGKILLGNLARCDSMTFNGCVFDGTWPNDNLVQIYLPVLFKLNYCTFKPAALSSPPGNPGYWSTAHNPPGTPYLQSWQLIAGFTNSPTTGQTGLFRTEMTRCDVWGNAGMEVTGGGSSSTPTYFNACYIHDQSDTDWTTGLAAGLTPVTQTYHQDGIGPDSAGPETWINVTGCTVASLGTTNAIAFQGSAGCNNCVITGNYFSGWELGISLSTAGPTTAYSVTFTDNVWSMEVPYVYGPSYQHWSWNSGGTPPAANTGMLWRRNRFQVFPGDPPNTFRFNDQAETSSVPTGLGTADNGRFWWPSDDNSHASDYTG